MKRTKAHRKVKNLKREIEKAPFKIKEKTEKEYISVEINGANYDTCLLK